MLLFRLIAWVTWIRALLVSMGASWDYLVLREVSPAHERRLTCCWACHGTGGPGGMSNHGSTQPQSYLALGRCSIVHIPNVFSTQVI